MNRKQRLELTWIGKDERPRVEPRILLEDPAKSHHASRRMTEHDLFDNRLIFGDNLLALKALEQEFSGRVKCIYIDPPFNTGAAFEHYDDGLEHSIWLGLMRDRLEILKNLLRCDGFLFLHLDDKEAAYAKTLCDEVFDRANYRNTFAVKANSPFGFKHTSDSIFKSINYLLVYARSPQSKFETAFVERDYDRAYRFVLEDRDAPYPRWKWRSISDAVANGVDCKNAREAKGRFGATEFDRMVAEYAISNARRVFRTASVTGGARQKRLETLQKSAIIRDKVFRHPNDDMDYFFIAGERVLFYEERLVEIDGRMVPGEAITDLWTDISWEGIASEGRVDFPKGKKPERLIRRVLDLSSSPGDLGACPSNRGSR